MRDADRLIMNLQKVGSLLFEMARDIEAIIGKCPPVCCRPHETKPGAETKTDGNDSLHVAGRFMGDLAWIRRTDLMEGKVNEHTRRGEPRNVRCHVYSGVPTPREVEVRSDDIPDHLDRWRKRRQGVKP